MPKARIGPKWCGRSCTLIPNVIQPEHVVHLIVIWPAPGWMTEHDYRYLLCGPAR
jgi:hypothetical protein